MSIVTPTQPVAELQPFLHHSRRVRAGTAPAPAPMRSRAAPVSDDERADALDEDALLLAARHRAEVKLAHQRGQREGERIGMRRAQSSAFWSGVVFGIAIGAVLAFAHLMRGLSL